MIQDATVSQWNSHHNSVIYSLSLASHSLAIVASCVSRLGYDLEGKCKEIAARMNRGGQKGVGDGGGSKDGTATGKPAGKGTSAEANGQPTPNYTSESITDDIYSRFAGQGGPRERNTWASKRSTSSVRQKELISLVSGATIF